MSASGDYTARVWNAVTGECEHILAGHTGILKSVSFSPDGQKIVSASSDKTVRVWCAATGACEQTLAGHTRSVASASFLPNGERIVSWSTQEMTVRL